MPESKKPPPKKPAGAPKIEEVDSSVLESIAYNESRNELRVTMKESGETYLYSLVPRQVYEELMAADSKGAFFNKWVRAKPYPYEKLDK